MLFVPLHYLNGLGSGKREEQASVAYQTPYCFMSQRQKTEPTPPYCNPAVEIKINEEDVSSGKLCDL